MNDDFEIVTQCDINIDVLLKVQGLHLLGLGDTFKDLLVIVDVFELNLDKAKHLKPSASFQEVSQMLRSIPCYDCVLKPKVDNVCRLLNGKENVFHCHVINLFHFNEDTCHIFDLVLYWEMIPKLLLITEHHYWICPLTWDLRVLRVFALWLSLSKLLTSFTSFYIWQSILRLWFNVHVLCIDFRKMNRFD